MREVAEYPNSFKALGPLDERIQTRRFTLGQGSAARTTPSSASALTPMRSTTCSRKSDHFCGRGGRVSTQWEIGSAAQPPELVDLLLARGMVPDKDPFAVALVLSREPPPPAVGVVVRLQNKIVCAGSCSPTPYGLVLFGGATVPQARGRGAYRALIMLAGRKPSPSARQRC